MAGRVAAGERRIDESCGTGVVIDTLAERLVAARLPGAPRVSTARAVPGGVEGAYRVQAAVAERLGPVGAFKCGRRAPDTEPKRAPVFVSDVHGDGAHLASGNPLARGVEIEIGFRLLTDPPPVEVPDFERRLRECVEVVPVFEIVGSRLLDPSSADALWQLADNQNNEAVVVGARDADARDEPLDRRAVRLEIGGRVVHDGAADVPGGDAFATLVALARVLGTHCGGLRAGQVVITGALSGPHPVAAGERVLGRIEGLGEVSVEV